MLYVWWNSYSIIHFELVAIDISIDSRLCAKQIGRLITLEDSLSALVNCKRVLYQDDNASVHHSSVAQRELHEFGEIEILPFQAYSWTAHHQIMAYSTISLFFKWMAV